MSDPVFRLVCTPAALTETPRDWARQLLADGEIALLGGDGGLPEIDAVAHHLDFVSVPVLRGESDAGTQDATVIAYAGTMPVVWIAPAFSDRVTVWGRDRGPMTLLVSADGPLPSEEQRRVARFVAALGRQSE